MDDESEKMFNWGLGLVFAALMLTAVLQVCFRVQDKTRANVRAEIVKTQQDIAVASANFAAYVRPEILRNMVFGINPKSEVVSFNKSIAINDIPIRGE